MKPVKQLAILTLITLAMAPASALAEAAAESAQVAEGATATEQTLKEAGTVEVPVEDAGHASVRVEHRRLPVPSLSGEVNHPYTIEIPIGWEVRRDLPALGVFLGPPGGDPNTHPEMLLVRESSVALESPEAILANIQANAEAADWSLLEAEVRDFGGVRGLWIVREMPPTGFHGARVSFAAKLPLASGSLDVIAALPDGQRDALAPRIEHMLRSIRPAEAITERVQPGLGG